MSQKNVLDQNIELCCTSPMTGFYRDGFCNTGDEDKGLHLVCIQASNEFLQFSKSVGNDLTTPMYGVKEQQLRIWYGEDLYDQSESDNYGASCVDVYVMFQ